MTTKVWYISKYANISLFGSDTRQASFSREFSKAGMQVRLILSNSSHLYKSLPKFSGKYMDMKYDGCDVTWINTPSYKRATSLRRLLGWLWFELFVILMAFKNRYEKPDVVIASSLSLFSVLSGAFYKKFYKSKFVFEVRDIWPRTLMDLKNLAHRHPAIWILRKIEHFGYRYSDEIVGTMPGLYKHVDEEVGLGDKVHFIPQGVNLDFYRHYQKPVNDDYVSQHLSKGKFRVIYAGTLGFAYALEHVISAAKALEVIDQDVHFVFVGDGLEKQNLKNGADGLSNVTFAPSVKKEQVLDVLNHADLLLHSFRMEKVFEYGISPNKFIDYMYAKKPIVCMFSGYPSLLDEANCGEFTPSEDSDALVDAILKYKSMNKLDRDRVGQNGYNFLIDKRSFSVLGAEYKRIIE